MAALERDGLDLVLGHDDELLLASVAVDLEADDGTAVVEDLDVLDHHLLH